MNDSDEAGMQDRRHEMLLRFATATKEAEHKIGDELARIEGTPVDAQSARRHHFIPQFWLRQFAEDGSLSVLSDDPQCTARSQPVKGTSVERDLYTTHAVGDHGHLGDDLDAAIPMERMLGVFENRAAPVLHLLASMVDGEDVVLSDLDRYWMSALIAFQIVRTPQSLAASRSARENIAARMLIMIAERGGPNDRMKEELAREAGVDPGVWDGMEWSPHDHLPASQQKFEIKVDPRSDVGDQLSIAVDTEVVMPVFARWWSIITLPDPILPIPLDQAVLLPRLQGAPFPWDSPGFLTAEEVWVPLSPRVLLLLHWNGPDARHQPAKGEQYTASFALKRCELACHPSASEQTRRVARAVRVNDAAGLTLVLNNSSNLGQQRTTFA